MKPRKQRRYSELDDDIKTLFAKAGRRAGEKPAVQPVLNEKTGEALQRLIQEGEMPEVQERLNQEESNYTYPWVRKGGVA